MHRSLKEVNASDRMMQVRNRNSKTAPQGTQGFSLVELLLVVSILAIITAFAFMGITRAKSSFHLANNGDVLKAHLERAFADARKRHALGNVRAKIEVINDSAFIATIDFDGDGSPEERSISLTDKIKFVFDPASPPIATIDWRGNIAEGDVAFNMRSDRGETLSLQLSSSGDSRIDTTLPAFPTITVTTSSADVKPSTVVNGNTAPNPNPSPTAASTPLPFCTSTQRPASDNCRCQSGRTIDDKGKCR